MRVMKWAAVVTLAGVLASPFAYATKPVPPKESGPTVDSQSQAQNQHQTQAQSATLSQTQATSSESASTATGGSSTSDANATSGVNVKDRRQAPGVFVGNASPSAPCYYVDAWGGSVPGAGLSRGKSKLDQDCVTRERARLLIEAGRPDLAVYLLVGQEIPADAIKPQKPAGVFHAEPSTCPTCPDCSEQARRALVACSSK